jgi:hypothetical protein
VQLTEIETEMRAAVQLTSLVREASEMEKPDLYRVIYLGVYAGRFENVREILKTRVATASIDVGFARYAILRGKANDEQLTLKAPSEDDWEIVERYGIKARHLRSRDSGAEDGQTPAISLHASPGFIARHYGSTAPLLRRIYLALLPRHARWFLDKLFERLAGRLSSFSIKVLANPASFFRADAAVIYVRPQDLGIAWEVVSACLCTEQIRLRNLKPLGTFQLGCGVGWADSPPIAGNEALSFGQWITETMLEYVEMYHGNSASGLFAEFVHAKGRLLSEIHCNINS